jgi:hypothetical protein
MMMENQMWILKMDLSRNTNVGLQYSNKWKDKQNLNVSPSSINKFTQQ